MRDSSHTDPIQCKCGFTLVDTPFHFQSSKKYSVNNAKGTVNPRTQSQKEKDDNDIDI
jgi:hypothetical protein